MLFFVMFLIVCIVGFLLEFLLFDCFRVEIINGIVMVFEDYIYLEEDVYFVVNE